VLCLERSHFPAEEGQRRRGQGDGKRQEWPRTARRGRALGRDQLLGEELVVARRRRHDRLPGDEDLDVTPDGVRWRAGADASGFHDGCERVITRPVVGHVDDRVAGGLAGFSRTFPVARNEAVLPLIVSPLIAEAVNFCDPIVVSHATVMDPFTAPLAPRVTLKVLRGCREDLVDDLEGRTGVEERKPRHRLVVPTRRHDERDLRARQLL
jgi:hypothetical protein